MRIFERAILALGVLLLLHTLAFYVREGGALLSWRSSGGIDSEWYRESDEDPWHFNEIYATDFPAPPVPAVGDTLLELWTAGEEPFAPGEIRERIYSPGQEISLRYRDAEGDRVAVALTTPRSALAQFMQFSADGFRFLTTLGYLLVGIWALLRRSGSAGVRLLALYSFAMAAFMIMAVSLGMTRYAPFELPWNVVSEQILSILTFFFSAFWLHLQLYFPKTLPSVQRRPLLTSVLVYLPQIAVLSIDAFPGVQIWGPVAAILISLQVSAGFVILGVRGGKTRDPLEKRQIRLVQWGTGIGLIVLFIMVILGAVGFFRRAPDLVAMIAIIVAFATLLLSPVSFLYAFGRYRLLEVEGRMRRGTRYVLVTGVLLLLFFGLLYGVSELLLVTLGVGSRTPTLLIALVLAIGFTPFWRWVQGQIERRFYPERRRLRALIADFHATAAALPDRRALWLNLEESLKRGLGISAVVPLLHEAPADCFQLPDGTPAPFAVDCELAALLASERRPLLVDELLASARAETSPAEAEWLAARQAGVLLPMVRRAQLLGFLVLAFEEGAERLTPETLRELSTLATQVALESENLRLLEETLDKQRLEEQLAMARQVQEGFLPSTLPETPGLKVAARFRASLEVAGDYYDVLALPEDQTLMAVGDVSGKGAGAAMIMANLQASIRSMAKVGVPLREMIAGINDIIHGNTPVEQFITFFAAVYDPTAKSLTYVNAGHNPPRLIRADGSHRELGVGGPILGVVPGTPFEEETVALSEGDLLLAFTDGVSEAMNEDEEEFGEERIVDVVRPLRGGPPEQALDRVEREVTDFLAGQPLGDDFTLLIACTFD